jgi:hypothetical protein
MTNQLCQKRATSGIPVIGWTYLIGCVRSRLYQSRQTMRSFVKDGDAGRRDDDNGNMYAGVDSTLENGLLRTEKKDVPC